MMRPDRFLIPILLRLLLLLRVLRLGLRLRLVGVPLLHRRLLRLIGRVIRRKGGHG
jgi:hypothetical protein